MEISFIHRQMNQNLRVNKTNFQLKDFALGLALKQRQKATRKSPIIWIIRSCRVNCYWKLLNAETLTFYLHRTNFLESKKKSKNKTCSSQIDYQNHHKPLESSRPRIVDTFYPLYFTPDVCQAFRKWILIDFTARQNVTWWIPHKALS